MIKDLFKILSNKVVLAVIVFFISITSFLLVEKYFDNERITELNTKVVKLSEQNKQLEQTIKNIKLIDKATIDAKKETEARINMVRKDTSSVIENLKSKSVTTSSNVIKSETLNEEDIYNSKLPNDVTRMLSDYCKGILGSPCPNP